jgi:hypothetical protein
MLAGVEDHGTVTLDGPLPGAGKRETAAARLELEVRLLVQGRQAHAPTGRHVTALRTWVSWAEPDVVAAAATLALPQATRALRAACRNAPILGAGGS